jgi:outer membrane protein assembly factor BamE
MRFALLALAALSAVGCVSVYRLDVQQGNIVNAEQMEQLKTGMTRSQVRFLLGTPLIADPFHGDRWDYYYYFRQGKGGATEARLLTLIFEGDILARIEGEAAPARGP